MAARGSRLSKMIDFFKTGDIEEARFVSERAAEIVKERWKEAHLTEMKPRTRRTKAQIAADKSKDAHTAMAAQA